MSTKTTKTPNIRAYIMGYCYHCQTCLHCNTDCSYQTCKCKNKNNTPQYKKNQKRKFYAQTYHPNSGKKSFNSSQINELEYISNYYGYNTDFSRKFDYSSCTKCHAKFWRLGKYDITQNEVKAIQVDLNKFSSLDINELEEIQVDENQTSFSKSKDIQVNSNTLEFAENLIQDAEDNSTPTFISSEDDEYINSSEIEFIEITFKLIIKATDGKCNAAKWETIMADNFQGFRNKLDRLIQEQFEDEIVFRDDYNVAYKQEKQVGRGTQLTNNTDWERFLKDNERTISQKKVLVILITLKRKLKKTEIR